MGSSRAPFITHTAICISPAGVRSSISSRDTVYDYRFPQSWVTIDPEAAGEWSHLRTLDMVANMYIPRQFDLSSSSRQVSVPILPHSVLSILAKWRQVTRRVRYARPAARRTGLANGTRLRTSSRSISRKTAGLPHRNPVLTARRWMLMRVAKRGKPAVGHLLRNPISLHPGETVGPRTFPSRMLPGPPRVSILQTTSHWSCASLEGILMEPMEAVLVSAMAPTHCLSKFHRELDRTRRHQCP